jgi:signal transduction histidine kinase
MPIVKLILTLLGNKRENQRVVELLRIVHNGTIHLENVINDALDVTRFENNKFEIHKEMFNIRDILKEVFDIMKFQIEQKHLGFNLRVSQSVPETIHSD